MLSPFARQLNTNYVPSDNEIVTIRSLVRKGEATLNDIERRTEELKQELIELAERWEAQKREVDEHKALLSPIKRIPVDILTSIFLTLLEIEGASRRIQLSTSHPGVVISHVCQHWRAVSLSTKLLWRDLYIIIPSYCYFPTSGSEWNAKLAVLVEMAQAWISRSDDCHLSLTVIDVGLENEVRDDLGIGRDIYDTFFSEGTDIDKLVDVLLSSSPRWEALCLILMIPQTQLPYFPTARLIAPPRTTPILTNVKLLCSAEQLQDSPLSQRLITGPNLLSTSALRSLIIGSETLSRAHDIMRIPVVWSNLEHLDFGGSHSKISHPFDAVQALTLLKECTNLITCDLTLNRSATVPMNGDGSPILLPRLRKLVFLPVQCHLPKGFAQSLILPSLRELEVMRGYGECTPREHHESGLFEFCERFGSTLEDVTFCYRVLTQTALLRCLQCLPDITSLGLVTSERWRFISVGVCARLNHDTLIQLTPQVNAAGTAILGSPLCPRIEVLRLCPTKRELAEEALIDFIVARRREITIGEGTEVARLREVDCGRYCFDTEPVQALRRRGIDVDTGDFSLKNYWHRPHWM